MSNEVGLIASQFGYAIELPALKSKAGYYIGTKDGVMPVSRESVECWEREADAEAALISRSFTQ
ncbi:MAG: hypothetical protein PHQ35_11190 [Phycisphaerae bacterium]|nr:hypothetical protein [Phycisphaerae bacterium]